MAPIVSGERNAHEVGSGPRMQSVDVLLEHLTSRPGIGFRSPTFLADNASIVRVLVFYTGIAALITLLMRHRGFSGGSIALGLPASVFGVHNLPKFTMITLFAGRIIGFCVVLGLGAFFAVCAFAFARAMALVASKIFRSFFPEVQQETSGSRSSRLSTVFLKLTIGQEISSFSVQHSATVLRCIVGCSQRRLNGYAASFGLPPRGCSAANDRNIRRSGAA
jgi:hypothetical protein